MCEQHLQRCDPLHVCTAQNELAHIFSYYSFNYYILTSMNNNDNAFLLWSSKVYLYNPIKHIFISSTQAAGGLNELKHRTDVTNAEYLMCDVQSVCCVSTLSSSSRIADISFNFSWWCWLDSLTKCYLYSTLPSCMSNKPWWLTYHLLEFSCVSLEKAGQLITACTRSRLELTIETIVTSF